MKHTPRGETADQFSKNTFQLLEKYSNDSEFRQKMDSSIHKEISVGRQKALLFAKKVLRSLNSKQEYSLDQLSFKFNLRGTDLHGIIEKYFIPSPGNEANYIKKDLLKKSARK
jgi:hypothetical protein